MITAEKILDSCKTILRQRGEQYGDADELYQRTAELWASFLGSKITDKDVCVMMSLMKLARLRQNTDDPAVTRDTYQDAINYIALAESLEI
tara:strand:+ start:109 stop:381 length:273 start_codon:yes stop_codon:yes gene_type:complete